MSQQRGQPRLFLDTARGLYFWHDERTDEYVYPDGSRIPVPRHAASSTPRTSGPSSGHQQNLTSQGDLSSSPPRDPNYIHGQHGHQRPQQSRPDAQQGIAGLDAAMNNMTIGRPSIRTYDQGGIRIVDAENPQSLVRARFGTSPANRITDPALYNAGVRAHRALYGTGESEAETLYSNYRMRRRDFFALGRVFMVLWVEPAGEAGSIVTNNFEQSDQAISTGAFNERVFSKIRRFVVIREGDSYCSALPITTYGGRGVSKPRVKKSEHVIIYTGRDAPQARVHEQPQRGEAGMRPIPIRVTPDEPTEALDPLSRLDFGKVHTVQHNIKVRSFGNVHPDSKSALYAQFQNVWTDTAAPAPTSERHTGQSSRAAATASSSTVRARPPRSTGSGGSRQYTTTTAPVAEESEESESGEDEDEEEEEASSNTRDRRGRVPSSQVRPAQGTRASSTAQPQQRTAASSSTASQGAPSARQEWAREIERRFTGQGGTRAQAFEYVVSSIQAEGTSQQAAIAEARVLLSRSSR